jgi:hypothetical protein
MQKIRNEFAHHVKYSSFNEHTVSDFIKEMGKLEGGVLRSLGADNTRANTPLSLRKRFLVRSVIATDGFLKSLAIIQAGLFLNVHSNHIISPEFGDNPENVKHLSKVSAGIVLSILGIPTGEGKENAITP